MSFDFLIAEQRAILNFTIATSNLIQPMFHTVASKVMRARACTHTHTHTHTHTNPCSINCLSESIANLMLNVTANYRSLGKIQR